MIENEIYVRIRPLPLGTFSPRSAPQTRSVTIVVFRWMTLGEILSPAFWANIWIDYSRFDEAYTLPVSAGFNIDVGNGHSTLLPTLFLLASMVRPLAEPKVGRRGRRKPVRRLFAKKANNALAVRNHRGIKSFGLADPQHSARTVR